MEPIRGSEDQKLDALFLAYKGACPDVDASVNFMPHLWQKIEARQNFTFSFQRMAHALVGAGLALSVALGVYISLPSTRAQKHVSESYIEALAQARSLDTPDIVGPVNLGFTDPEY